MFLPFIWKISSLEIYLVKEMIKIINLIIVLLCSFCWPYQVNAESGVKLEASNTNELFETRALGEQSKTDSLITYAAPAEFPFESSPLFTIKVGGRYTAIYNDVNAWNKIVSFGYFDMLPGQEIEVQIDCAKAFSDYDILPKNNAIVSTRRGNTIYFKIKQPQALTVVFDDCYQGEVLHLFANAIDQEAPTSSSENLIYFGPGYHHLDGPLTITGKQKIYIAGGAVVHGRLSIDSADGASVTGRGMLMRTERDNVVLGAGFSKNVRFDGILIHNHRSPGWTAALHAVSDLEVENVKVVSTRYASTDGFDIVNSNRIHFNNVFIRSCDDAIAIKGLITGKPADCPPNEIMLFENMQLWNDCNNAMCMGAETRAAHYSNITFRNIDVLYSYDDRDHHSQLDERSVMTIVCLEGTFFRDICFEAIRVNRCQRLVCLTFKDSFWFGTLRGDQSTEGGISDVMFKNITSPFNSGSSIANEILLNGWAKEGTPTKYIQDVTFDNVLIEGEVLTDTSRRRVKMNNSRDVTLVKNITFTKAE